MYSVKDYICAFSCEKSELCVPEYCDLKQVFCNSLLCIYIQVCAVIYLLAPSYIPEYSPIANW